MPWWGILLCILGGLVGGFMLGTLMLVGYIKLCFDVLTGSDQG